MKALYAGSFDPFTVGHLYVTERAINLFDSLVIGVGYNEHKKGEWSPEERVKALRDLFADNPKIEVEAYSDLTVDFAKRKGVDILVRGVRNGTEFEKEKELASINKEIGGINTVMIPTDPNLEFVSSSMVRELMHHGHDASKYIAGNFTKPKKLMQQ